MPASAQDFKVVMDHNQRFESIVERIEEALEHDSDGAKAAKVNSLMKQVLPTIAECKRLIGEIEQSEFAEKAHDGVDFPDGWEEVEEDFTKLVVVTEEIVRLFDECLDILEITVGSK